MTDSLAQLIERGGPVVVVLLGLSVLALAISALKLGQFVRARLWSRGWLPEALDAARMGAGERALALTRARSGPLPRVLACAIRGRMEGELGEDALREEVERVATAELAALESNLRGLETIAVLAPLLGLLGTVMGMIQAFIELEEAGSRVEPALLAGGIWEALLTTAVGLTVAIPTTAVLAWLESQVARTRRRMEDAVTRVLTAPRLAVEAEAGSPREIAASDEAARHAS